MSTMGLQTALTLAAMCSLVVLPSCDAKVPHIIMHLADDFGWANAGWHRSASFNETHTPNMEKLITEGIELDQAYSYQFCSPSRCSLQSGRLPVHVNTLNLDMTAWNPNDPISGFAGIPRNMTGVAQKLKMAGYSTHQIGKWDAGMATETHTPQGRGYDTSLGYFHHANDYWSEHVGPYVDFWDTDKPAYNQNSTCYQCTAPGTNPNYRIGPEYLYEEKKFVDRVLEIINNHDPSVPLFINYDSHIVHSPLQSPTEYYHDFDFMTNDWDHHRQLYASMVSYLDNGVGKIRAALEAKGMWEDTMWFFQSDNGGPSFTGDNHTANNFPLKGAKYTNWQGGIRVNAFVSGGYLNTVAPHMIGKMLDGYVTIADYYATFAGIAGVDPTDTEAAKAGLPPIDSMNMWPYFTGQVLKSPRHEIFQDHGVLLQEIEGKGKFKLLIPAKGDSIAEACFPGEIYPNGTVYPDCKRAEPCPNGGCLYNLDEDPTEHHNLSGDSDYTELLKTMIARLAALQATEFNPLRTGGDPNVAAQAAATKYHGFWGPFVFP